MPPVVTSAQVNALLQQSNKWRLMPETLNNENLPSPSTYYGAVHLTRLFGKFTRFVSNRFARVRLYYNISLHISVKLPELLQSADIPSKKLKVLLKYLDMFLRYVETNAESSLRTNLSRIIVITVYVCLQLLGDA